MLAMMALSIERDRARERRNVTRINARECEWKEMKTHGITTTGQMTTRGMITGRTTWWNATTTWWTTG